MGLRTQFRRTATLAATGVLAALLVAPGASAKPCLDCEEPTLPPPGGDPCPTIAATVEPSLRTAGAPAVTGTVTARTGSWNSNTKTIAAQWFVGTSAVGTMQAYTNATARDLSFSPRAEDLGKPVRLWVRGIGDDTSCTASEYSPATDPVTLGPAPINTVPPTITGSLTVGSTLTGTVGSWTRQPDSYRMEWSWTNGTPRGTGPTLELTPQDLGKGIRFTVHSVKAGHHYSTAGINAPGAVAPGAAATPSTAPSVTGTPVHGGTLVLDPGQWPAGTEVVGHQWLRDGEAVPDATGTSYTAGLADIGTELSVTTTVRRAGYLDATSTVSVGTVVKADAPRWTGGKVRLVGKDKVRKKLKVALGVKKLRARADAPDATISFQWLRQGKSIAGATGRKHVVVKKDRRKKLSVRITLTRPGHHPLVITTKAVKVKNSGRRVR